ncbi:hypothetical protein JAAARDRAFT_34726 [Jaapia argillacea MUCL 33604]|uniref:Uncharacterized protein n=1 Tax=Jaapia argillacea MUCL 33604 TaxID=933084 RepID=A0A067Q5R9_9AGAM|nr:hypothetical protein JAAARDRAFT_34726 [Jaapia argillacea MUCL 33604]
MGASSAATPKTDLASSTVTRSLVALGALTLGQYFRSEDILENRDHGTQVIATTMTPQLEAKDEEPGVALLYKACQSEFGRFQALDFEFIEGDNLKNSRCILTIKRPDGISRSYTSTPSDTRQDPAKTQVTKLALRMGALEFISNRDSPDRPGKSGTDPIPLSALALESREVELPHDSPSLDCDQLDGPIRQIEESCEQRKGVFAALQWVYLSESKPGVAAYGSALKISLSPHCFRVYSVDTVHPTFAEAKRACATLAIDQGILEFIHQQNGRAEPSLPSEGSDTYRGSEDACTVALQSFYDSLPRPLPEDMGDKSAAEVNAPAWLNSLIQSARGGRLSHKFIWTTHGVPGSIPHYGCVLRISRPSSPVRTHLVDAVFSKRTDAKAAVCLLAMSQGAGDHIRSIVREVEEKLTSEMRKLANERILPMLQSELNKVSQGGMEFEHHKDMDAYGCSLTILLSTMNPAPNDIRKFRVPAEYRNKHDSKLAVLCLAADQGALEFIRFRGEEAPLGYQSPFVPSSSREVAGIRGGEKRKREQRDDSGVRQTSELSLEPSHSKKGKSKKKKKKKVNSECDMDLDSSTEASEPMPLRSFTEASSSKAYTMGPFDLPTGQATSVPSEPDGFDGATRPTSHRRAGRSRYSQSGTSRPTSRTPILPTLLPGPPLSSPFPHPNPPQHLHQYGEAQGVSAYYDTSLSGAPGFPGLVGPAAGGGMYPPLGYAPPPVLPYYGHAAMPVYVDGSHPSMSFQPGNRSFPHYEHHAHPSAPPDPRQSRPPNVLPQFHHPGFYPMGW